MDVEVVDVENLDVIGVTRVLLYGEVNSESTC